VFTANAHSERTSPPVVVQFEIHRRAAALRTSGSRSLPRFRLQFPAPLRIDRHRHSSESPGRLCVSGPPCVHAPIVAGVYISGELLVPGGPLFSGLRWGIEASHQSINSHVQCCADAQEGRDSDRPARFNLLPMASREAKSDHVLLTVSPALAEAADSLPHLAKELLLIVHPLRL